MDSQKMPDPFPSPMKEELASGAERRLQLWGCFADGCRLRLLRPARALRAPARLTHQGRPAPEGASLPHTEGIFCTMAPAAWDSVGRGPRLGRERPTRSPSFLLILPCRDPELGGPKSYLSPQVTPLGWSLAFSLYFL